MKRAILLFVCALPVVGACLGGDMADDCHILLNCPLSGPPACEGTCVPLGYGDWEGPFLAWLGDGAAPMCPLQAPRDYYSGVAPPPPPSCGECACEPSTGSCALPTSVTANAGSCMDPGSGTAFDPPAAWDGSCTTQDAIPGGVASVTVAPLVVVKEGCVASKPISTQVLPPSPTVAQGCQGIVAGVCMARGSTCLPAVPPNGGNGAWTYCIMHEGAGDAYTETCPSEFTQLYAFGESFKDTRTCSPCSCGAPEGSACTSDVSLYSDSACVEPAGSVIAQSSAPMCVDTPTAWALGSKQASAPVYRPGTCPPSGGPAGAAPLEAPMTLCCLPQP
jgi:hypothetical protein